MSKTLDDTLTALADPTRRRVVDRLRGGPLRAGELAHHCRMSAPAMSRHLRVLREHGLIEIVGSDQDGRVRRFRLRRRPFQALRRWLDKVEDFWGDQLEAFAREAGRRSRSGGADS